MHVSSTCLLLFLTSGLLYNIICSNANTLEAILFYVEYIKNLPLINWINLIKDLKNEKKQRQKNESTNFYERISNIYLWVGSCSYYIYNFNKRGYRYKPEMNVEKRLYVLYCLSNYLPLVFITFFIGIHHISDTFSSRRG